MNSAHQVKERTALSVSVALVVMLAVFAATWEGCATIVSGTTQQVSFQSSPEGVVVTLVQRWSTPKKEAPYQETSRILGKTPLTVELKKIDTRFEQTVVFSKDGYKPVTVQLTDKLNPWFWGNIAIGGMTCSAIDAALGGGQEYEPNRYFVTLVLSNGSTIENATLKTQQEKAREYIVLNYKNILVDIQHGNGENLKALVTLLHIETSQETDALRKIRAISEANADAPEFANHIIALFLK